jgi:hypothetical protein
MLFVVIDKIVELGFGVELGLEPALEQDTREIRRGKHTDSNAKVEKHADNLEDIQTPCGESD